MSDAEIATETRPLLDRIYAEEVAAFRDLYASRTNSGRGTTDVAQAARAATMGAIATLLVDIDTTVPGTVDEETGAVTFAETETASNYGVLAVRASDLPAATPLAAILRFPVLNSLSVIAIDRKTTGR